MPQEPADSGRDNFPRFDRPRTPWWRPSGAVGRAFLGLGLLIVLGGLATGGVLLRNYLDRDARFRIAGASNVEATGLTEVSRAELLPVFGEDIGRNIFFVPLAERRKQLEEIPWVERATVMRLLPDQIRVSVVERHPVAFVRHGQQIGLVDANGVLLEMPPAMMAQHHYSFPVVTGLEASDPLPSRKARMAVYAHLMADLDANGQKLSEQISEIDLTDPEDARVRMPESGSDILAHFGDDRFLERYQRYKAHIAEWRQQYPKLAAVDLRYEQQVVLEMDPGSSAAPATPPASNAMDTSNGKAPDAEKPPDVTPAVPAKAQAEAKPAVSAKTSPPAKAVKTAKKMPAKPAEKSPAKTAGKAPVKAAGKTPDKLAKTKTGEQNKRAETAKHAALNPNRQKPVPKPPSAASTGQGQ
jgi:cell division protein FtsQ